MIKFTQSFRKWLWDNHQDKFALILFGHTEMVTEEMYQEYLAWVQTDEGRKYLKGGECYDENDKGGDTK